MPPEIQTTSPNTEVLLEHSLIKGDENSKKTHLLLEDILVTSNKNSKISQSLAENQLEIKAKIVKEIGGLKNAPRIFPMEENPGDKQEIFKKKLITSELVNIIKTLIPAPIKGDNGKDSQVPGPKGEKGDKGERGEHGFSGRDGLDGLNGMDGLDGLNGKNGKDGRDAPTAEELVKVLKNLPKEKRISYRDLKDAPEFKMAGTGYLREITDVDTRNLQHGQVLKWNANTNKWEPSTISGGVPLYYDLSASLDGITKVFTIPTNSAIISITSSSTPFTFRPVVDFSGSGTTTLTFSASVDAASMLALGQTIMIIYAP